MCIDRMPWICDGRAALIDGMDKAKTMAKTPSPTGLYWSERGAICCARHTPYEHSDTWNWERWEPVPREALAEAHFPLRCECCGEPAR